VRRVIPLVALAILLSGCGGPPAAQTQERLPQATFTIGLAQLTRRDVEIGRAALLAAAQLNAKGGVGGAVRVAIVTPDEAGAPEEVARRLVQRGVQAIVLSCEPEAARAQADVASRTAVLAFQPCVDDPTLSSRFPSVWPVSLPANAEAAALADVALTRGYTSLKIVGDTPIARYLRDAAPGRELAVDGGTLVSTLGGEKTLVYAERPLLGTHLLDTEAFAGNPAAEGVAFTTYGFPTPNSAASDFYTAFEEQYGRAPSGSWVAVGYDAIRVAAHAIEEAGSSDPDAIAEQLGRGLSVQGGLGQITYPGAGEHLPETAVAVVEIRKGKRVLVEKSLPEGVPRP
jgi:ABC-type branched-subunit amino acid transport system substrate-binding protein